MSSSATFNKMRVFNAEQFKESVSESVADSKLYLTFGKVYAWANDANPVTANASVATEYEIWNNMIAGKRILGNDLHHVVRRVNWTAGTSYAAYDHESSTLYDGNTNFYILTSDYNVYKCIANNNSALSTIQPSAINPASITQTSDGYVWKYMYTVTDSELLRFTTTGYMPVKYLTSDDGSLQYTVQQEAVEGAIYSIVMTNNGSNYTNASNIIVTVTGDGTSATATATLNTSTNTVSSITLTDYGSRYTYATVAISGGAGTNAAARAIISPLGGHGKNPLYELGGAALMISPYFRGTENGNFKVGNDFRQISLLKDPVRPNSNAFSNLYFSQAYSMLTSGTGEYNLDEYVYQGGSLSSATFYGRVLNWSNNTVDVINTYGTPTSQSLIGANSSTSRFVSETVAGELKAFSGQLLYVNNLEPIIRDADQTEEFKIVVKF